MNSPPKYSRTAIALHWVMAVLIIGTVVLIWFADYVADEHVRWVIDTHKSIGITVLGLAIWRLVWRITHTPPDLPGSYAPWEKRASGIAHGLLYVLLFLLPLSGWLHDSAWKDAATHPMQLFGLVTWPRIGWVMSLEPGLKESLHTLLGNIHAVFGYCLYVLFMLHVLAVVKHQVLDHESEIQRMLP